MVLFCWSCPSCPGTGTLSWHHCLGVAGLQGGNSLLSRHLLLPGVHGATSRHGPSAGEVAAWDPSWEEMLCMHEGFGVTVTSPMPGCLLAPRPAKAVRLLLQAPTAAWGGCGTSKHDGGGPRALLQWWWWSMTTSAMCPLQPVY